MKRFFIIGTDTDCGKTYVTRQLVYYFKSKKQQVMAIKPVATGCWEEQGGLINEDIVALEQANGFIHPLICPWRFKPAVSPHIAAAEVGCNLTAQAIATHCFAEEFSPLDCLLIEGAGGLMVPLNEQETWIEVLALTQIPVILVVGMRLGCLNHALLTASVLAKHQLACAGWIANCVTQQQSLDENINTLVNKITFPLLGVVPGNGGFIPGTDRNQPIYWQA